LCRTFAAAHYDIATDVPDRHRLRIALTTRQSPSDRESIRDDALKLPGMT
jgi:hypothetical protein